MSAVKNSITLTRDQAKWLAEVGLSASSADDVTPVICGAHVTVTGDEARVTATDRYRVSSAIVKLEGKAKDHTFLLPREALVWLNKNAGYHGRYAAHLHRVVITTRQPETGPHTATISVQAHGDLGASSVTWSGDLTKGNFPPVYKLIEKARDSEGIAAPVKLNLDFLAKARPLGRYRGDYPLIKFTMSDNPNKPGPVLLTWTDDGKVTAEALVQPALVLS